MPDRPAWRNGRQKDTRARPVERDGRQFLPHPLCWPAQTPWHRGSDGPPGRREGKGGANVGKASRRKKQRITRPETGPWDPAIAARRALRDRRATATLLEDNPYAAARFAGTTETTFQHTLWHHVRAGLPLADAWHETAAWIMGEAGYQGPWPHTTQLIADYAVWERENQLDLLRNSEICVVSPDAHAALVAAALTLEATDLLTLDRDTDIPLPAALVVMPEPVLLSNQKADVGELSVLGWSFTTMYGADGEQYPAVGVSAMLPTDGAVQSTEWREFLAEAKAAGHPLPAWMPAGTNGMRADASSRSTSSQAAALLQARARHLLHHEVGDLINADPSIPAPQTAQWSGEPIADPYNNFADRYLFAFWRLAAQGATTVTDTPLPAPTAPRDPSGDHVSGPRETAGVRLVDLRRTADRSPRSDDAPSPRRYSHRWPVRMHKVNQWYPTLGRHKVLWRGPFIQGPADAPLRVMEKAYHLSV
ncbi:hypothetical protein AQF52_8084 [Streptomyces venezuelae]|nr:hypothetical protein AQF52_0021 [Streptomyces venezuelae]ALO13665.1 hypothetical protein AQF52_8084 [Streptomyces venezuelae]